MSFSSVQNVLQTWNKRGLSSWHICFNQESIVWMILFFAAVKQNAHWDCSLNHVPKPAACQFLCELARGTRSTLLPAWISVCSAAEATGSLLNTSSLASHSKPQLFYPSQHFFTTISVTLVERTGLLKFCRSEGKQGHNRSKMASTVSYAVA